MKRKFFPMGLQLFAGEGEGGQTGEAAGGTQTGQTGGSRRVPHLIMTNWQASNVR